MYNRDLLFTIHINDMGKNIDARKSFPFLLNFEHKCVRWHYRVECLLLPVVKFLGQD